MDGISNYYFQYQRLLVLIQKANKIEKIISHRLTPESMSLVTLAYQNKKNTQKTQKISVEYL